MWVPGAIIILVIDCETSYLSYQGYFVLVSGYSANEPTWHSGDKEP